MSISQDEVKKIAHLARLSLDEQEVEAFAGSLSQILGLIEQMNAVDTTGIAPMSHPRDATLRLRPDEVTETDQRDKLQANAPAKEDALFLVPKVIE